MKPEIEHTIPLNFSGHSTSPSTSDDLNYSIKLLATQLIQKRSDPNRDQQPVLNRLSTWFQDNDLPYQLIKLSNRSKKNKYVGLLGVVDGAKPGPAYCLTACLDTAPLGVDIAWKYGSLSAHDDGEKIYGRGSADSKFGTSIFTHIFKWFYINRDKLAGKLIFLADTDEHNGRFGAVKTLVKEFPNIDGCFIGYPGDQVIKIGSRGFYRAMISFYGQGGHSGSRSNTPIQNNAIYRAAAFITDLSKLDLNHYKKNFDLPPKLSVTRVSGGGGYTNVPDKCVVGVDFRTTPEFRESQARKILHDLVHNIDRNYPADLETKIRRDGGWPAYKLDFDEKIVVTLSEEARKVLGKSIPLEISGPSNVGNFLSKHNIPAICGFGVGYENLHASNEAVYLNTVIPTYNVYLNTLRKLYSI